MKHVLSIALLIGAFVSVAQAATTNFQTSNISEGGYVTRAERKAMAAKEKTSPGFWDKEYERSGLKSWGDNAKGMKNPIKGMKDFFKNQEERYIARQAGATDTSQATTAVEVAPIE